VDSTKSLASIAKIIPRTGANTSPSCAYAHHQPW
jgi:hypothetical protein